MSETVRTLTITEAEETALVEIIRYFNDMGLPDNVDSTDYDTLTEKAVSYTHLTLPTKA